MNNKQIQDDDLFSLVRPDQTEDFIKWLLEWDWYFEVAKVTSEELNELFADENNWNWEQVLWSSFVWQWWIANKILLMNRDIEVVVTDDIASIYALLSDCEKLRTNNFMFLLDTVWKDWENFDIVKNSWFELLMRYLDLWLSNNIPPNRIIALFECFHDEDLVNAEFYNYLIEQFTIIYWILKDQSFTQEDLNRFVHIIEYSIKDGGLKSRINFIASMSNKEKSFSDALFIQCEILNS